jgi:uncharacterized membrane protein YeaQ/YmgE (transglycosylase-associated protein family)
LEKRTFTYIALALLVWAISGTVVAGYYFTQYNIYQNEYGNLASEMESILMVNILVSYGNGTKIWHNNTALPVGSTAFKAILAIADVEYTESEFGVFVTSINGVVGNSTHFWLYWGWDAENSEWIFPDVGSSQYILHRGDTIAWTYESEYPPSPPT